MTLKNRIKCAASIDSNGAVILGAARPGFRALAGGWAAVDGEYPYLLEDDANPYNWEIGLVRVTNGAQDTFSSKKRLILDGSPTTGFANGSTSLTFSQGAVASGVWAGGSATQADALVEGAQANRTNMAVGPGARAVEPYTYGSIAIGAGAIALDSYGVAIGQGAQAKQNGSIALGAVISDYPYEIALGTDLKVPSLHFLPMKAFVYSAGTGIFTAANATTMALNFATWALINRVAGPIRISGRMAVGIVSAGYAGASVVDFDYMLWADPASSGSVTVIGTPIFTAIYTGASAMAITYGVNAGTGAMTFTSPGAGWVQARALARIDNLACA